MAAASVATLSGVSKTFDHTEAVAELSLDVAQGQIFGLIGPSGCGKTTTGRTIGSWSLGFEREELSPDRFRNRVEVGVGVKIRR